MAFEGYFEKVSRSAAFLKGKIGAPPKLFLVLSGGLSAFLDKIENPSVFSVSQIPHFPSARAEGHKGELTFGLFNNLPLAIMQGRFHYYEGLPPQEIVFPYFVLREMGASFLVTTNAVGGLRSDLKEGDILAVTDHINLMGTNPLIGLSVLKPSGQFPSMQNAYDGDLIALAEKIAREKKIPLKKGVFLATPGPSYETPAEIRMMCSLGADCVGMSSVFEVIAARYLGLRVLMLNIVANVSAERHPGVMSHEEVLKAVKLSEEKVASLLEGVVAGIAKMA